MTPEGNRTDAVLRFRVLGPLEIRDAGGWHGVGPDKWRRILAELLVHAGKVVPAETLTARLWGHNAPLTAPTLIRKYVMEVRRTIGDEQAATLLRRPPGYLLCVDAEEIDAGRFERLTRAGRHALTRGNAEQARGLCAEALSLWRGQALVDVAGSPSIDAEASRLEELRLGALETRIEADLITGRVDDLVAELRRLVAQHRLRESLWCLLMRALCAAGRTAEALEAYAQVSSVLKDELGAYPSEGLQALHAAVLANTGPPPPPLCAPSKHSHL